MEQQGPYLGPEIAPRGGVSPASSGLSMGLVDTGAALTEEEVSAYQAELEWHMAGANAAGAGEQS